MAGNIQLLKDSPLPKKYIIVVYVELALVTLAAYEPLRLNGFLHYDDDEYITENPNVVKGITRDSVVWAFTRPHFHMWHPVTSLSHELDCQFFGLNPFCHHLTSLLFHVANVLLLFWVLKRMTGAVWLSAFVAAVFAVHPLQVQSVAWAAERKTVLSGFFWLLTMIAYVRYTQRPHIRTYLLVVLMCCLALLSKPTAVTLPFALLLLDYWPLGRFKWAPKYAGGNMSPAESAGINPRRCSAFHLVIEKVPLLVLSAVVSIITYIVQQSGNVLISVERLPFKARLMNAATSYFGYIIKIFYPDNLAVIYPYPKTFALSSVALLIAIIVLLVFLARRRPWVTFGLLWYLGTLIPVIGIVQAGDQAMADRYTYLPSIGIFIIVAWGAAELGAKRRYGRIGLAVSAVALIVVLSVCTRSQLKYWKNDSVLFKHAIAVTGNNSRAHQGYAKAMLRRGKYDEAAEHYKDALEIEPGSYTVQAALGAVLLQQGKTDEAAACFRIALQLKPDFPFALSNLGVLLAGQGKVDEGVAYIERAINSDPDYPLSYYCMARIETQLNEYKLAIKYLEAGLRRDPDWSDAYADLGKNWYLMGNTDRALVYWHKALQLNSGDIGTLAVAYAAAGNFTDAVKTAKRAIDLAETAGERDLAEQIKKRLALYQSNRPFEGP
jgi:tetratricopeptide (TPR) repeat protein